MTSEAEVRDLDASIGGTAVHRDDPAYAEVVASPFPNLEVGWRPAVAVRCADVADVRAAVDFAAARGFGVAPRGGGVGWHAHHLSSISSSLSSSSSSSSTFHSILSGIPALVMAARRRLLAGQGLTSLHLEAVHRDSSLLFSESGQRCRGRGRGRSRSARRSSRRCRAAPGSTVRPPDGPWRSGRATRRGASRSGLATPASPPRRRSRPPPDRPPRRRSRGCSTASGRAPCRAPPAPRGERRDAQHPLVEAGPRPRADHRAEPVGVVGDEQGDCPLAGLAVLPPPAHRRERRPRTRALPGRPPAGSGASRRGSPPAGPRRRRGPSETLLTNTRPFTSARSTRRSRPSTRASRLPTTSSRSTPRSRAKWLRVPAGTQA